MSRLEKEQYYAHLVKTTAMLQRNYNQVYPHMLVPHLNFFRCEQQIRKDMGLLARRGLLSRVGGYNRRRGYNASRKQVRAAARSALLAGHIRH